MKPPVIDKNRRPAGIKIKQRLLFSLTSDSAEVQRLPIRISVEANREREG
jgi:hypothetical protein